MTTQPKTRTEYRVVGDNFRGEPFATSTPFTSSVDAEANLRGWQSGGAFNARIQQRSVIVTETPWVDVEAGEGHCG